MEKLTEEESSLLTSALNIIVQKSKDSFANVLVDSDQKNWQIRMQAEKEYNQRINQAISIKNKLKQIQ